MSKVIFVTGAGRGLGTDIARQALAATGSSPPDGAPRRSRRPWAARTTTSSPPSWTSPAWTTRTRPRRPPSTASAASTS
ncbi:hypothetical protein [Streptomyces caniscabiei]|uniref:hypothetical protein n=1 Tax=Streptomyces caniscabiei TaxID=2746961 RepID=UPI0029BFB501|nr:hypothetical protein [Streptomyces caniscabiei]